jgi:hypothetical protein
MLPAVVKNPAEIYEEKLDVHGAEPAFNDDGVDLSLIRRSLDLSTTERVRLVEGWARAIKRARVVGE